MVIFSDLSDVLISGLDEAIDTIIARYGKAIGVKCWHRLYNTQKDFGELMRGKISEAEFYRRFLFKGDWPFGARDIQRILSEIFKKKIPGTLDVYSRIISHPCSSNNRALLLGRPDIYIVSDHITERIPEIMGDHPDIFALTRGQFWSCETGKLKRDAGLFAELLMKLNLRPEEVILIDDNPDNIRAAKVAGIGAVRFYTKSDAAAARLERDLQKCGFGFAPKQPNA